MADAAPGIPARREPQPLRESRRESRRALLVVVLLILAILVWRAVAAAEERQVHLSSWSAEEAGARGFYETVDRLGWPVARRTTPLRGELDTAVVWVSLAPWLPPTSSEVHALLESVRRGAGLLVVLPPGVSPLTDSLGFVVETQATLHWVAGEDGWEPESEESGDSVADASTDVVAAPLDTSFLSPIEESAAAPAAPPDTAPARAPPSAVVDTVLSVAARGGEADPGYLRYAPAYSTAVYTHLRATAPWPEDTVLFLAAERYTGTMTLTLPVAVGLRLGRGRVVVVSEPRVFMNDVVREDAGVLPVRMVEWLAPPGERALVFDEFHHGYGSHASLGRATRRFLGGTPVGRTLVVLLLAGALLVLALGARPFAPAAPERIERRSPIEHVGALSRAYDEVGATRLAARRLARGLRRRRSALGRPGGDAEWLREVAERHPALAGDVTLLLDAMQRPLPPERFVRLAPALARIERTIAT